MNARVYLVDDHEIVRRGLAALLETEPGLTLAGQAASAQEAQRQLREVQADVALVDISLGGTNGLELVKQLAAMKPDLPVLILSSHDESVYAERSLRAGARGYCSKDAPTDAIRAAIKRVLSGRIAVSDQVTATMLERMHHGGGDGDPLQELSDRELEVFELIGRGLGTRDIADQLHLSVKTVESHRARIKRKLNIESASQLVRRAVLFVELG